ncbi:hypothetical protein C5C41_06110 [Rathayibacter sp. AY1E9]|uniref:hypothetical protein n=1 Tax=unclassified Rathayibacter TaxID=2609250 RepID=UPI000CE874FC|nr:MULTISPECIES: hypothetical protein [unclassified Rathayibacter]PPG53582.1 hypothetical protein C5C41_06110 [Rathayibacter sp. AY1E9]PPG56590.1 hypothetical protein C5C57_14445 [Rathayibacter sp. AY1C5]
MVSPLVRKIVNKHERDIRLMQRTLFTDAGDQITSQPGLTNARLQERANARARQLLRLRGRSLTNRRAEVSVLMDRGPAAELEPGSDADPTLSLVSVSVKGLSLLVGNSEILEPDEYTAWAQGVVGEHWATRLYSAGALSGSNDKRLSTLYFYVFTDQDGSAVNKSVDWSLELELGTT